MTVKRYIAACLQFASDTASWGGCDDYKFYTTTGNGWQETPDNSIGGISVKWAFHQTPEHIKEYGAQYFIDGVTEIIHCLIDNKKFDAIETAIKIAE